MRVSDAGKMNCDQTSRPCVTTGGVLPGSEPEYGSETRETSKSECYCAGAPEKKISCSYILKDGRWTAVGLKYLLILCKMQVAIAASR